MPGQVPMLPSGCFYSSAEGKSPHLSGQPQHPLLVQLVQGCVWTQSSQAPVRTTGQYCWQRKGESQSPFLGNICGPMETTNHNFKNKLFGMKGRALLQFISGFGFSKELAGFWNKPSLNTDLWGHRFCLIADRELILLKEGRELWLLA